MTDIPLSQAHHLIVQNWGNRLNFQTSYGLKMTPEDIEEGNLILKGIMEETMQQEEERKKKENMRVLRVAMKVHREGLAERRRSQEAAEMAGENGEARSFKKEMRKELKREKGKRGEQVIIEEDEDEDAHSNSDTENDTSFDNGNEDGGNDNYKL